MLMALIYMHGKIPKYAHIYAQKMAKYAQYLHYRCPNMHQKIGIFSQKIQIFQQFFLLLALSFTEF
jgi:hypothetical protein